MGLLIASVEKHQLRQEELDLQYKLQLITKTRRALTQSCEDLTAVGANYDADSPMAKSLEQRKAKLQVLEKQLEQRFEEYQDQLKMIAAQRESAEKMFDQEVQKAFKY